MIVYTGVIGLGKTTKLIKQCSKYGGYIVCHSIREASRIHEEALQLDLDINLPITYEEFLKGRYGAGCKQFYIDNVDILLQQISKLPIKGISINTGDK